ncbi:hypothetical protein [Aromatoleum aromaticum]|uniref:hypothetical protein n=1 Tax=Aromatoleum aromaticum TaxID=551760 RepID=UPI00145945BE|nr:hypothetical protein [Aromatoleum aromaticum]NMG53805.1 hypothetical protein [Aromatoleum aromaticum]
MSVNRRFVLKSMALSSIAGVTMGSAVRAFAAATAGSSATAAARPVVALANEGAAESIFLYGALAASDTRLQVQRVGRDPGFVLDFERQLRSRQPMRLIGLLDDASAALVVDMARSGGARVQWLGQHIAEAGFSRHHLLNTDSAEGCSQQFSRELQACGAGFSLNEERQNGPIVPRRMSGPSRGTGQSAQWASSIGYLLASLGTRMTLTAPLAPTASAPITGSFVSFSIEA